MALWQEIQSNAETTYQLYARVVDTFATVSGINGSDNYNRLLHKAKDLQQRYLTLKYTIKTRGLK